MNRIYTFNESKKIFAENFKELMEKKKYTVELLAKKTGYSEISIKKWRAGDRIPTFDTLAKLAKVFKTTIQKLYLPKSYYEKDITPEFLDFLFQQREIGQTDYHLLLELVDYNRYLVQKMLFSFLTPEELDHLESIYRYYIITDKGKSSLNLNDDLSFESFYTKSKEYVLNKYGPSLPYKITPLEQIQLITDFNQYIRIKYVKEYVTLL